MTSHMHPPPLPMVPAAAIGWLDEAQMVEVDRTMVEDYRIGLIQMMENAGRNLALLVLDLFAPSRAAVVSGSGGNGGGGLVAARHLANAGVDIVVTTSRAGADLTGVPAHQFEILRRMGVATSDDVVAADVSIDALIGVLAARCTPRPYRRADRATVPRRTRCCARHAQRPGRHHRRDARRRGVGRRHVDVGAAQGGAREAAQVGELYLADISVPRAVTAALGPAAPDFARAPILRVV